VFQVALGVIAAIGGFVDIGELVFNTQAGAQFGYLLLWAVVVGVIGIAVYAEMCGRVAAVAGRPVFDVVRVRLGFGLGLVTLIASEFLTLLTLAAEVGGIALVLQLLLNVEYAQLVLVVAILLLVVIWFTPFGGLERIFGYGGLALLVFVVAALHLHPSWHDVGYGFVPHWRDSALYAYFIVGVIGAALTPYEVHFYSSGAIEEKWTEKDLGINRANAFLGFGLGGILSVALIMTSAQVFRGMDVQPQLLGTAALAAGHTLGQTGMLIALAGMLFAIGGAVVEVSFAGAYNLAQFAGWEWGKYQRPRSAPRFTLAWVGFLALAFVVVSAGVNPVDLTEYAVVLSVVALPLTYLPVMLVARDRTFMGDRANGRIAGFLGWLYLVVIVVIALAAIPLLFATSGGA
jgi:Mn2+/Fe2+ NRAMP family transporter